MMERYDVVPNMYGSIVCNTGATSDLQGKRILLSGLVGKHSVLV